MTQKTTIDRILQGMTAATLGTILLVSVNGCLLLAAGAAGAGAGYIAAEAADDDEVHVVREKEVIVEKERAD